MKTNKIIRQIRTKFVIDDLLIEPKIDKRLKHYFQ